MISKRDIRRYLDDLFSSFEDRGDGSGALWYAFHEYVLQHYKRLDKGARAFVDKMFDELDAKVAGWIDGLPEGPQKRKLYHKISMVKGARSPLPVVYLDTPVIEAVIRQGLGQKPLRQNIPAGLFEQMKALVQRAQILCPETIFHREVLQGGGEKGQQGLDILRALSEGSSFRHGQTIEDFQVFRAFREFVNGSGLLDYRAFWKDAFPKKTVRSIYNKRSTVAFYRDDFLLDHTEPGDTEPAERQSIRLRVRYDVDAYRQERLLEKQLARHLRDLVRLGLRYRTMLEKASLQHLQAFWEGQNTTRPLALWNICGKKHGRLEDLADFFESPAFRHIPALRLKGEMWNALSGYNGGPARSTGPADIGVLSAVLPYTDMMILGPNMSVAIRDHLELGRRFDTEIYSLDEGDQWMAALERLPNAD